MPFALLPEKLSNYWYATGTPSYLEKLLRHNHEQINELTGKYYDPSMFVDYKADEWEEAQTSRQFLSPQEVQ